MIFSGGGVGSVRLNTVPFPKLPSPEAAPYKVFPAKINPAYGEEPSVLALKLCKLLKAVPSV